MEADPPAGAPRPSLLGWWIGGAKVADKTIEVPPEADLICTVRIEPVPDALMRVDLSIDSGETRLAAR